MRAVTVVEMPPNPEDPLRCVICGDQVDASGPGIYQAPDGRSWSWVAFVEDWRGGYFDILHPKCLAESQGIDALVAAVHARDVINRPSN